jgi:hypothetical protein
MTTRELLGPADVSDAQLAAMVADLLHEDQVALRDVRVEPVDYDLPAITTAGRYWVSGHATTSCGCAPFRLFVKHVQSWSRHPFFAQVPEEYRQLATDTVPWRTEALLYRSDLGDRLPEGLSLPRALGVFDLDELSAAVWLEEVPKHEATWDVERYRRAAYLLGRLAASPQVAPLAGVGEMDWNIGVYAGGRLAVQVVPLLMADEPWQHPLAAAFGDELRERLRAAARISLELAAEADTNPYLAGHGDACPNNLLAGEGPEDIVLIDFGFWMPTPVGFDLSQLLLGEVQLGHRPASTLAEIDRAIVPAYVEGLRAEGCGIEESVVWRSHALCMLVMSGLSALPFDLFDGPMTDEVQRIAADRAEIASYCLDLLDATQH